MPRKRGKSWYTDFVYTVEGRTLRHRQLIRGARVKPEAVEAETKIKHEIFQGWLGHAPAKDKPLADFIKEDFIPWAEQHRKQPRHYRSIARLWTALPSLKGKTVRQVTQFDVEAAKITRRRTESRYGEPVLPQTVNRELIIVSSFFHRAVEWGYRDTNPCRGVERLPFSPPPPRSLTAEETGALLDAAWEGPGYLPYLIIVGLGTGLRQVEMRLLKKTDVDLCAGLLFVNDPKWKDDPRRTKGVPLGGEVRRHLAAWMAETRSEWVFPSPTNAGQPLAQQTANKSMTYACARAGIESVGLHALRYTFGTRLSEAGVRLEVL